MSEWVSECNVIPAMKRHWALANSWSSLGSKFTRYYPSRVIFEKQSFALMLSWAFLSRPKLRLLNRLGLSSIPLKERVERYIYGPLEWLTSFSATAGCNFLGKNKKPCNALDKKSEKSPSLLTKTEKQRLNSRKPANLEDPNTEKPQFSSAKTEKPNQIHWRNPQKRKSQRPLSKMSQTLSERQ